MAKLPRNRELLVVEKPSKAVFQNIRDFIVHHVLGRNATRLSRRTS
jgi:hypothetical protein